MAFSGALFKDRPISLIKFARKKEVRIQWSKERRKDAMEQGKERKK